jgi:hypothetical protein
MQGGIKMMVYKKPEILAQNNDGAIYLGIRKLMHTNPEVLAPVLRQFGQCGAGSHPSGKPCDPPAPSGR